LGTKQRNYNPLIDDLMAIEVNILVIDNPNAANNAIFSVEAYAYLNSTPINATSSIKIIRTGIERPLVNLNATFLNQTNVAISSE
jgi:hypothetical protein